MKNNITAHNAAIQLQPGAACLATQKAVSAHRALSTAGQLSTHRAGRIMTGTASIHPAAGGLPARWGKSVRTPPRNAALSDGGGAQDLFFYNDPRRTVTKSVEALVLLNSLETVALLRRQRKVPGAIPIPFGCQVGTRSADVTMRGGAADDFAR